MTTHPTAAELLQAVIAWMESSARNPSERNSYLALVARNALGIVVRELESGAAADLGARGRLISLLALDADLPTLEAELSNRIRTGAVAPDDPALLHHLRLQTAARLAIDQPHYRPAP
jgi:hypothetical protein